LNSIKTLTSKNLKQITNFVNNEDDFFLNFGIFGWNDKTLKNHLNKTNNFSLGFFNKNQILGIIIAETINQEIKLDLDLQILYVSSKMRRKKIASELLKYVEKTNDITNISKIYIEVSEINLKAINFYKKNNFVFLNFRHNYYRYKNKSYRAKCFLKKI
tara:strand:- start:33 stop:509 length:477 start_codon:yes stop_codon:yes gene_type:complete